MLKRFALIWITLIGGVIGWIYVNYIYPEESQAQQPIDLVETYNLTNEQIQGWLETYPVEEVESLIANHINQEIQNGAEPIEGTVNIRELMESASIEVAELPNESKEAEQSEDTFFKRLVGFILEELLNKVK